MEATASTEHAEEWLQRLRECGKSELDELLDAAHQLDTPSARAVLRNPHADEESIQALCRFRPLHSVYEFRRDVVLHKRSPTVLASQFLPTLFWRDLARVSGSVRLRPALRRAADRLLIQRLPKLTLGETIALARIAGTGLHQELGRSPQPRVITALLQNSRMTEGLVLQIAGRTSTAPEILATLAKNARWGVRYAVRFALCRNPQTPLAQAVALVASLRKVDQRRLKQDHGVREAVRRRAALLADGGA